MNYWLMKSEPDVFSIDDLAQKKLEPWEGVRNYQARNMLRDIMQVGDLAFFYHSSCAKPGIVGIMEIITPAYPDSSAWDPQSPYFDAKSTLIKPRWFSVDVTFKQKFSTLISLAELKAQALLSELPLVKKGNRLSIMQLTKKQWDIILALT